MEVWKKIPGWGGYYEVSDLGRVRGLRFGKIKIKKQSKHVNGYLSVGLCYNEKRKVFLVHRLVYWAFKGVKSCSKTHIDHINEIKTDNRLSNLRALTSGENVSLGMHKNAKGCRKLKNGRYQAVININKVKIYLGRYKNQEDATKIYKTAFKNKSKFKGNKEDFKKLIGVNSRKARGYSIGWYDKTSKWRVEVYCEKTNRFKHYGYFKSKVMALVSLKENNHIQKTPTY